MNQSLINLALVSLLALVLTACSASNVSTKNAAIGKTISMDELRSIINKPGPIRFKKHLAATWSINLSGLLNLDHPLAKEAGLTDREEPIELYVYSLVHPSKGNYLVDSGISEKFIVPEEHPDVSFLVKMVMGTDALKVVKTTKTIVNDLSGGVNGVFLTHIHMDHIFGVADLPPTTRVYTGPGESRLRGAEHLFTQGTTDRLLANAPQLEEWQFGSSGIVDIFGDKSVFAIHTPGHTPGSTAYLVRSTNGPQLLIGDATHTRWGWNHGVEPGSFSADQPLSAKSLQQLIQISADFPAVKVHPGHQSL